MPTLQGLQRQPCLLGQPPVTTNDRMAHRLNETNWLANSPALPIGHRNTYKGGARIEPDPSLDWAANLAHQMGARQGGP